MSSVIGGLDNVKIYTLYLLAHVAYPVDYNNICDMIRQTDFVNFFDFAECFYKLVDDKLILEAGPNESGETCYYVSEKGRMVAEQLKYRILQDALDRAVRCGLQYLDFKKRGITLSCRAEEAPTGGYTVHCVLKEKDTVLLSMDMWNQDKHIADYMEEEFRAHPENVYRGIFAVLTGKIEFIFNADR